MSALRIPSEDGRIWEIVGKIFPSKVYFPIGVLSDAPPYSVGTCSNGVSCRHVKVCLPVIVSTLPISFSLFGSTKYLCGGQIIFRESTRYQELKIRNTKTVVFI